MPSFDNIDEKSLLKLKKYGFCIDKTKSIHEQIRYIGKSTLILYKTNKLLIQGSKDNVIDTVKLIEFLGIVKKIKTFVGLAVGTDETLKGDTFGGIVVAGFKADDNIRKDLIEMGVKDSKKLIRPQIVELAMMIIEKYPKNFHVEDVSPKTYNQYMSKMNVTKLLDKLHLRCYNKLSKNAIFIVDKYPGCDVGDIRETKADSKYPEVAAASIIARYYGLLQIKNLEQSAGFFIPFGSSNVESGLLELRKKDLDPSLYVKVNFRNVVSYFER